MEALLNDNVWGQFLYKPTQMQQRENIAAVLVKYKLTNLIVGVDGCLILFLEKPRRIPAEKNSKDFINRKNVYSINSQIVGGFDWRI